MTSRDLALQVPAPDGKPILAGFIPSAALCLAGIVFFFVPSTVMWIHWARTGRKRYMLTLTISMTVAALRASMTFGFIFRLIYRATYTSLGWYVTQYMFILLSPCGFLAIDYMLLARLALALGEEALDCLLFPAWGITQIFIWSDVCTFALQAIGAGMATSKSPDAQRIGPKITLAGLAIQLASFVLFTTTLITFGLRLLRRPTHASPANPFSLKTYKTLAPTREYDWRPLFIVMSLTCIGILVRSVFRLIEFSQGYYGYLAVHEGYFYALDALALWLAMVLYCFFWPVRFIEGARDVYCPAPNFLSSPTASDKDLVEKAGRGRRASDGTDSVSSAELTVPELLRLPPV